MVFYVNIEDMIMQNMLKKAEAIARKAHEGQYDKGGRPFIGHPESVSSACLTEKAKITGWLHDVVEDTEMTMEEIRSYGFDEDVMEALKCVTKTEQYDENEYYTAIRNNPVAREVKLADLTHNMDLSRIPDDAPEDFRKKMIKKRDNYMRYYTYLTGAPEGMSLREFENGK